MSTLEANYFLKIKKDSNIDTPKDDKDIEEVIIDENDSWCLVFLTLLFFPPFIFVTVFFTPIKYIIRFDRINNQIVYFTKNMVGCRNCCGTITLDKTKTKSCRLYKISFSNFNNPMKRRIYIQCEVESIKGNKFNFFEKVLYKPELFEELGEKFQKCIDTEVDDEEVFSPYYDD